MVQYDTENIENTFIKGFLNILELSKKYKVSGCDNLIGGTLDNVDLSLIHI